MPEQRFKLKIEDLKKGSDSLKDNLAYFDLLYGFSCISGMSVRKKEDIHSKILAIFLSYGKDGYAALKSFLKTISSSDVRFTELNVRNPNIGFNDNFVDISIKDEQYYIIIENKIKGANLHWIIVLMLASSPGGVVIMVKRPITKTILEADINMLHTETTSCHG